MSFEPVPDRPVPRGLHYGAVATVVVALFPLVLGMIVTSIRAGMADALHPVFVVGSAFVFVALLAALFIREIPLRRGSGTASGRR